MNIRILCAVAMGWACSAGWVSGQSRVIQPSPAYDPAPAQPVPAAFPPAQAAPRPAPRMTLAPAPAEMDDEGYLEEAGDEEGIYWFWGQKWPGIALGPKIGTTGIGVDLTFGINRFLNLRGGFNYGSFTFASELADVEYDMDVDLVSIPLLVDLHPFANHFRITGGFYLQPGGSKADINATPTEAMQIGSHIYSPEVIGTLSGEIKVSDTITPYLGIGFGNAVGEDQLLTFMVDFGVIFQSYDVSLTSNGAGMTTKLDTFRKDLQKEEAAAQKDMDDFKIFPVLTFGIAWHF